MAKWILLSAFLLMLISCDSNRVYEMNTDFVDTHWLATDTVLFPFSIADTASRYHIILNVRNSIDFETARLFINYKLLDSASMPIRSRLIEHSLFDKKSGEPFGESGLGSIYEHHILVEPNISFPYKGEYLVKLNHMMRVDTLQEVHSVGVKLERATLKQ